MCVVGIRQLQDPYYHGFAAQISFYLLLSVVPLLILITQLLGLFDINVEWALGLIEQYTDSKTASLINYLFRFNSIGFGNVIFLVIALWAGSRATFAISRITNYTITEGHTTGKNYFIERIRALGTTFITVISLALALVILCYGKVILLLILSLFGVDNTGHYVDSIWMLLRWPLGFMLYFAVVSWIFYITPTVRRPFRRCIPGGIFAAVGMIIVTAAYSFYNTSLVHYSIMYGALSSVVALMIWFLLISWVIILGVLCNKVCEDTSVPFSKKNPPEHLERYGSKGRYGHTRSKYDIDPEEVDLHMIKDILTKGAAATEETAEDNKEETDADT